MVKTKRKHLDALDAKKNPRLLAEHERKSDPTVHTPSKPENCAKPELSPYQQQTHPGSDDWEGHTKAEGLPTLHLEEQKVEPSVLPLRNSPSFCDGSDADLWVEVRKQRIIIIIPALPKAQAKPRNLNHQVVKGYNERKQRAVLHQDKAEGKVSRYCKRTATSILRRESKGKRSHGRRIKENTPPISSMDILLASALVADRLPWQRESRHRTDVLAERTEEEASLDTADSSIQARRTSFKAKEGRKLSVKGAPGHAAKKGTARVNMNSKHKKPFMLNKPDHNGHITSGPIHGHEKLIPGNVDKKEGSSVLSFSEAFKVLTLKKHLDKAGGLRNWLCSIGLGQFKEIFEKRLWSEGELLDLNMDDLKKMGKHAVGPRRKLLWAIHHTSQQLVTQES